MLFSNVALIMYNIFSFLHKNGKVTKYPVISLPSEKIVDTNGAGDAFVGGKVLCYILQQTNNLYLYIYIFILNLGFVSQYLQSRSIEICILCGIWVATEIIQQDGCVLPADLDIPEEFRVSL